MKKKLLVLLTTGLTLLCAGCGSLYESTTGGYTQVKSVEGACFDMADSWLEQATAITHISDENDYSVGTYLYKDGKSSYLLFDISSVVVCVENDSNFGFAEASSVEDALKSTSLAGIWFSPTEKNLKYDTSKRHGSYKMIADVNAEVSVTSELYGNFAGKLASVSSNDYECTLFIGARADSYDELTKTQLKLINHICKSLNLDGTESISNTEEKRDTAETENADITNEFSTEINTDTKSDTEMVEAPNDTEMILPEQSELDSETESESEVKAEEETELITSSTEEHDSEEKTDDLKNTNDETESQSTDIGKNKDTSSGFSSLKDNQSVASGQFSDIYHMLNIGDTGTLQALNNSSTQYEAEDITINALYTGEDAVNIIRDYCKTKNCPYKYEDAPRGTKWHVIEYTIDREPTDLYANIKLVGLDGEKLKYRGVSYSTRTHDIFYKMTSSDGKYTTLYCYYAVPNGCKEYALQIGDQIEAANSSAAYYIINNY